MKARRIIGASMIFCWGVGNCPFTGLPVPVAGEIDTQIN